MTTEAATIDDVYAAFGRAADAAQALEVEAGNVALAMLAVFAKQPDETKDWNGLPVRSSTILTAGRWALC